MQCFYVIFFYAKILQNKLIEGNKLAKLMYEYINAQVPVEAKELIDEKHKEAKKKGKKTRKADLWIDGAKKAKAK